MESTTGPQDVDEPATPMDIPLADLTSTDPPKTTQHPNMERIATEHSSGTTKNPGPEGQAEPVASGPWTLQPYEAPRFNTEQGRRGRRPPRRQTRDSFNYRREQQFPGDTRVVNYKKFFTIKTNDGSSISEIDVFRANRELESKLSGKPAKISETRAGTLIVEVKDLQQSQTMASITSLAGVPVTTSEHGHLNEIKGTIWYANNRKYSEEEILEELKQYGAKAIYQTKKRVNNVLIPQPIYIITFDSCSLPTSVDLGWTRCSVRLYIPRPRRCFKCQGFGHGAVACRREMAVCFNCSQEQHELPCTRQPLCANCYEPHPASSTNCRYFKVEAEIVATQTRERISYHEAKRKVKATNIGTNKTFAEAVRHPGSGERSVPSQAKSSREPIVPSQTKISREPIVPSQTKISGEPIVPSQTKISREPIVPSQTKISRESNTPLTTQRIIESSDGCTQTKSESSDPKAGCGITESDRVVPIPSRKRPQGEGSPPVDRSVRPKVANKKPPIYKPDAETKGQVIEKKRDRLSSDSSLHQKRDLKQMLKDYPMPKNFPKILPPSVQMRAWDESGREVSRPTLPPTTKTQPRNDPHHKDQTSK